MYHDDVHLHSKTTVPSYTLRFRRYGKILKANVTAERSKVNSRSHFDDAHLQPPTNAPTNYHLPTPYGF